MRGADARDAIVQRITADLAESPHAPVQATFNRDSQLELVGDNLSGVAGAIVIDDDDELTDRDFERALAWVAEDVFDNLWSDDETPWPLCPTHRDHAMQPKLLAGRAVWTCLRGAQTDVRVGELAAR